MILGPQKLQIGDLVELADPAFYEFVWDSFTNGSHRLIKKDIGSVMFVADLVPMRDDWGHFLIIMTDRTERHVHLQPTHIEKII